MTNPNIIFIMADDMGYGDLGCYNSESQIPTPNMDKLAAEGLRFTDAHSSSAVCTPSRYSVMTGRYCWRTHLSEGVIGGYSPPLIEPERLTVASMLKKQGYHTACIGKWHIGSTFHDKDGNPTTREKDVDFCQPVTGGPNALGFDYAYYNAGCGTCSPPYGFIENERFVGGERAFWFNKGGDSFGLYGGMMAEDWVTKHTDLIIAEKAVDYIEAQSKKDKPFFLYLTPNAPHEPCIESVVPEFARGKSDAGHRGDLVWLFDWIVGEVMNTLERTGQVDNTLVMVTSDNGALAGDFVWDDDGHRVELDTGRREFAFNHYSHKSNGDCRGYKAHIWEGGHREPLIAWWPGTVEANSTSDQLVCLMDLMATCAAITGYQLPATAAEDSCDIGPVLLGEADEPIRDALIHHSSFGVFSIRQGQWKLVLDCADSGGWTTPRGSTPQPGTPGQLFDMVADPGEQNNLWENKPEVVEPLTKLLQTYKDGTTRS